MPSLLTPPVDASAIEEATSELLKEHGLYRVPVNPVEVCEHVGVPVFRTRFTTDDTCSVLRRENGRYVVYFDERQSVGQQTFAIAHALGHFVLHTGDQSAFVDKSLDLYRFGEGETEAARRESQANLFAAALLMPENLVREAADATSNLGDLARMFLVSEGDIGHRLARLGAVA